MGKQDKHKLDVDKPGGLYGDNKYKDGVLSAVGEFLSNRGKQTRRYQGKKQEQGKLW